MQSIYDRLVQQKIIAIVRGIGHEDVLDTVEALIAGGIQLVEFAINQKSDDTILETFRCIKAVKDKYGDRIGIGAGTVITGEQVIKSVNAGAEFILSPNTNERVIAKTKELGKLSIPGAFTPTEVEFAYRSGANVIKVFPAGMVGADYIKDLLGPLNYIPMIVVGGVNIDNIGQFLQAGAIGAGIGGCLVNNHDVKNHDYEKMTKAAKAFVLKVG